MFGFEQRRGGGAIARIEGVFVCEAEAELVLGAAAHKVNRLLLLEIHWTCASRKAINSMLIMPR